MKTGNLYNHGKGRVWGAGNIKTVSYCTMCIAVIGFALLLSGAIISGIAYTEVRPNVADENYDRYIKTNVNRVIGPIMLAFGLLNILGGCCFFGAALFCTSRDQRTASKKYSVRASQESLPDVNKKMLDQV